MASGCVPSHASYFLVYEHLKVWLNFSNDQYNFAAPLMIGATTTFAHDFFMTPADGKLFSDLRIYFSDKAATLIVQEHVCFSMYDGYCTQWGNERAF